MLVVEGLTCRFGTKIAVDNASFSIAPGGLVGVIGRSGAGKSTLLRMINRLAEPSEGRILFEGQDVTALRGRELRQWRARSAMILQQFKLVRRLDVLTNVLMGRLAEIPSWRSLTQLWPEEDKALAMSALEQFDMPSLAAQLSAPTFGQRGIRRRTGDVDRPYCARALRSRGGRSDGGLCSKGPRRFKNSGFRHGCRSLSFAFPTSAFSEHCKQPTSKPDKEGVMINRRIILAGAAALVLTASTASAQEWKTKYPELTFAVVPAENASGVTERWTPFVAYLSKELGVKVNLRIANDYAAVIEGQRAGNIHIASYGSASFARARLTGVKTDAFANDINADGSTGYYSMFFVKASSPYKSIDQLKGKNLGLVDPNSTSGNNVPRFELDKMGISDAETYFGKVVFTGSHENALLALSQGTVDVVANQWTSDDDSTLAQMLHKGMLKHPGGTAMKKEDFRIIHKSAPIINGPYAYNSELPENLKAAIAKAFFDSPPKYKAAFDRLSDGQKQGFHPATTKDWDATIDLIKFVDNLRKKKAS